MQTLFLQRPEGAISYDDTRGQGPLVICVPSIGDMRAEYRFLRPILQQASYRVVTMDMRGQGESSVPWPDYSAEAVGSDIVALIRHLNAGPATVVGTSMAAAATVWAAARAPEMVSRVVLVGPFVRDLPMTLVQRVSLAVFLSGPWRVAVWAAYYGLLYPTARPPDFQAYRQQLKANLSEPGRFNAVRAMLAASKAACSDLLPKVSVPTLVIMGTRDADFPNPSAEAAWISAHIPGSRMRMIEGAGHYPHAEMPEQVGPEVLVFLQEGD